MTGFVVGRNSNIDELQRRIGIAKGNDRDVDVRGFTNSLVVHTGVGDNDETGLLEGTGDVVGEASGGETSSNSLGTGAGSELQDGTLAVGPGSDNANVVRVLNSSDYSGSENDLFPGLANVDDVNTCRNMRF